MHTKRKIYSFLLTSILTLLSIPLQSWDGCGPIGVTTEVRVAYYHPSSSRVRRIYGNGWADYQFEISKAFRGCRDFYDCQYDYFYDYGRNNNDLWSFVNNLEWRIWAGISGFSRRGNSIGCHDDTRLQLIPISLGVKLFYPIFCDTKIFVGGGGSYSYLRIRDDSDYVHEHIRKKGWGGVIQSGITYTFCDSVVVSAFADYFFQKFNFHDKHYSSYCGSRYFHDSRFIERNDLDLSGYKVGVGLGVTF